MASEQQNVRAALAWLLRPDDSEERSRAEGELALRLAAALGYAWAVWGDWQDGRRWLTLALERAGPSASPARARGCFMAGWLARLQDDPAGQPLLEESLAHFRTLEDASGSAWALYALGLICRDAGKDPGRARTYLAESLAHFRVLHDAHGTAEAFGALIELALACGETAEATRLCEAQHREASHVADRAGEAAARVWLGQIALVTKDYTAATMHAMASLGVYRELRNQAGVNHALYVLGCAALHQGDVTRARDYFEEKLAATCATGDRQEIAFALDDLARAVFQGGAREQAHQLMIESLTLLQQLGDQRSVAHRVAGLAEMALRQGHTVRAVELAAFAHRLLAESGTTLTRQYDDAYVEVVASARAALDDATFEAAWTAGAVLRIEQVVAEDGPEAGDGGVYVHASGPSDDALGMCQGA